MSKELTDLIHASMKDRDLFIDILVDVAAALSKRKITLPKEDSAALQATVEKIRQNITGELTILDSTTAGGRGFGFVGW